VYRGPTVRLLFGVWQSQSSLYGDADWVGRVLHRECYFPSTQMDNYSQWQYNCNIYSYIFHPCIRVIMYT